MKLINTLFKPVLKYGVRDIDDVREHPEKCQQDIFDDLVKAGKQTKFGRDHDFKSIKNVKDFQQRVPIQAYEDLFPYIERMLKGEENVLWNTPVNWFAKSAGTTNDRSKYIPVSNESLELNHYAASKDMMGCYLLQNPNTQMYLGKGLSVGGSLQENPHNSDTNVGDVSAILMKNLPIWAQLLRAPKLEYALLGKFEEKMEALARQTINENITSIQGVPSWTNVLLKRILEITGKDNILEVWPNLEFFVHGGISFEPYRANFKKLVPKDDMNYIEVYNASEGYFAMQDRLDLPGQMLLMLKHGVFFEFVPLDQLGKSNPQALLLQQVDDQTDYALCISTYGGLWRYLIGDTVRFTNLKPYRIKISGRTKQFINAFGEELMVANAEKALAEACEQMNATVHEFTVAPQFITDADSGYHEWWIEFETPPTNAEAFTKLLDERLQKANSDYEAKRQGGAILRQLDLHIVPEGTFYKWMKSRDRLGGQNKVPRLSGKRKYVESIKEFVEQQM